MGKKSLYFLSLLSICLCLCGCETISDGLGRLLAGETGDDAAKAASEAVYIPEGPRIRVGVFLIVQISTLGQPPREMEVMVDQNGEVTMPYLLTSPVKCDGLTLDAFRQKLVKRYQEFILQPQVTARFSPRADYPSPYGTVKVMGLVANPGPVNMPPTMDLTVTKAIQAAGGLRQFADKRKIQVTRREKDGSLVKTFVDLEEIGAKGLGELDMELKAGDVVYVHETWW